MDNLKYQIISTVIGVIAAFLAAKQNIFTWPLFILSHIFSFFIYKDKGLYAQSGFTIFAIIISLYGIYLWSKEKSSEKNVNVTRSSIKTLLLYFILGLTLSFILGEIIKVRIKSEILLWDTFYAVFAAIAHWLLVNKRIEAWVVWFVIDMIFANVCLGKGLYVFVIEGVIYSFICIYGYLEWRKSCTNIDEEKDMIV